MNVKHGYRIDITDQLSPYAAQTLAQWVGCYTVITNQKTIAAESDYRAWLAAGRPAQTRPETNTATAHLQKTFEFLREVPCQIRRNAGAKWFEAMSAAQKGVRSRPVVKAKSKKRNCYVTNELFRVQSLGADRCVVHIKASATRRDRSNILAGIVLPFSADSIGKAFYLSRQGRRFCFSIAHDVECEGLSEDQIRQYVGALNSAELDQTVRGYDLGVVTQAVDDAGENYHYEAPTLKKLATLEQRKRRYQRRYSRIAKANDRKVGRKKRPRTGGEKKSLIKVAHIDAKIGRVRQHNAHRITRQMADAAPMIVALEDLKLEPMGRRPKAKTCPDTGRALPNGAHAKAGLNRSLKAANLGRVRQYLAYKLRYRGKLLVTVPAAYSSQECSACGHTEAANRPSQSEFFCQSCGFTANADHNAAINIKRRGITHIQTEAFLNGKTVRKVSVRRKKAQELASSGSGEDISPGDGQAILSDALNRRSPHSAGRSEARPFRAE